MLTDKEYNKHTIHTVFAGIWAQSKKLTIYRWAFNSFHIKFPHERDKSKALKDGPWSIAGKFLVLTPINPSKTFEEHTFTHTPFWVQVYGLPREKYKKKYVEKMARSLGSFLLVDDNSLERSTFLRFRVLIDLTKSPAPGFWLKRKEGHSTWVEFKLERLNDLCFGCGLFGHQKDQCTTDEVKYDNVNVFGPWLLPPTLQDIRDGKATVFSPLRKLIQNAPAPIVCFLGEGRSSMGHLTAGPNSEDVDILANSIKHSHLLGEKLIPSSWSHKQVKKTNEGDVFNYGKGVLHVNSTILSGRHTYDGNCSKPPYVSSESTKLLAPSQLSGMGFGPFISPSLTGAQYCRKEGLILNPSDNSEIAIPVSCPELLQTISSIMAASSRDASEKANESVLACPDLPAPNTSRWDAAVEYYKSSQKRTAEPALASGSKKRKSAKVSKHQSSPYSIGLRKQDKLVTKRKVVACMKDDLEVLDSPHIIAQESEDMAASNNDTIIRAPVSDQVPTHK